MAIGNPITLTSNVASKTISVIATAGQTLFTVTGGYRINQLAVFRNGVRLLDSRDYEARNGSTVTLLSAATVGDALEFQVFDDFRVADAIVSAESEQTIQGNLTVAGILTATDLSVTDLSLRHLKATGISTVSDTTQATSTTTGAFIVSGGVGIAKSLYVGGNVSVAGTLSYEDVTNVDSVGIITARSGVEITGGNLTIPDAIIHAGDTNTKLRFPAADTFTVETSGSEVVRVTSGGDVGIGTEAPETPRGNRGLEVAGTTGAEIVATRTDDNLVDGDFIGGFVFKNLDAGGTPNHFAGMYAKANGTAGSMNLHFTADRAQYEADTSDLTIKSGLVGIGTDDPDTELEIQSATDPKIRLESQESGSKRLDLYVDGGEAVGTIAADQSASQLAFRTAGSERVRIDASGRVGIGTDNPSNGTDTNARQLVIRNTADASARGGLSLIHGTSGTGGFGSIVFGSSNASRRGAIEYSHQEDSMRLETLGSERVRITGIGSVGIGTDDPNRLLHLQAASSTAYSGGSDTADYNFLKIENTTDDRSAGVFFQIGSNGEAAITATEVSDGATDITFQNRGGGVRSEKLRIDSGGTLFSFSPDDTTPNFKWRSDDTNWHGALNISVEGGSIASFWSTGGDWSVDDTTYSCTKNLAAYPSAAIALHNQYSSSFESKLVFLNKAGGSTTTDGAITELVSISSAGVISDSIGPLRRLGIQGASGSFTLAADHAGKLVRMNSSAQTITVPQNIFTAGDMISIFNVSTGDTTIASGTGITLHNSADASTGNRTLGAKGICTIVCSASNEFVISGSNLS